MFLIAVLSQMMHYFEENNNKICYATNHLLISTLELVDTIGIRLKVPGVLISWVHFCSIGDRGLWCPDYAFDYTIVLII